MFLPNLLTRYLSFSKLQKELISVKLQSFNWKIPNQSINNDTLRYFKAVKVRLDSKTNKLKIASSHLKHLYIFLHFSDLG